MVCTLQHRRANGDTLSLFAVQLRRNGTPTDLTDRVVKFVMYNDEGEVVVPETSSGVTISNPVQGHVEYDFKPADFDDFNAALASNPSLSEKAYYGFFRVYLGTEVDTYPSSDEAVLITIFNPAQPRGTSHTVINREDIIELAKAPRRVRTAEGTVEERSINDLIAADRYASSKAADAVPWGIRIAKTRPPSPMS